MSQQECAEEKPLLAPLGKKYDSQLADAEQKGRASSTSLVLKTQGRPLLLGEARDLKVDGCQSNLYVLLKQLLFF